LSEIILRIKCNSTKIVQLLDDSSLRQKMGKYERDRVVSELSWEYEAPKLLRAYEALFEKNGNNL